jgi:type II secretory pathway component PulM
MLMPRASRFSGNARNIRKMTGDDGANLFHGAELHDALLDSDQRDGLQSTKQGNTRGEKTRKSASQVTAAV